MAKGKQTCKILKEIRKQIAEENDIELVISECTYQGDCLGTCPKCEAEVRYLERELEKRQRMGKAAVFAGMTIGTAITATGCGPLAPTPDGMLVEPDDTITATTDGEIIETEGMVELNDTLDWWEEDFPALWADDEELDVYQIVEQMPAFPGGEEKLIEFVSKNVEYPQEAKEKGVQGRVFVGFVVEKDGSVGDVKLLRGIGHGCDEEALRVVQGMPKWKPGMHNGEFVRVSYQIPIHFKLEDKQD